MISNMVLFIWLQKILEFKFNKKLILLFVVVVAVTGIVTQKFVDKVVAVSVYLGE